MNPYRDAPLPLTGPRWGITLWKKLYVRIARKFIDLRSKYKYQRQYRQYERDLADWRRNDLRGWYYGWGVNNHIPPSYERYKYLMKHHGSRYRRPMPVPPPIYIEE